jgi:DNA repair protein RecO (recombination protein O)
LVRYELLLLGQLGFGLDLERCTVTGVTEDLAYVSPKSGAAVSVGAAFGYEARLFPLPAFLGEGGAADWPDIFAAGRITAHFLARDILVGLRNDPMPARVRLFDRFKRAVA